MPMCCLFLFSVLWIQIGLANVCKVVIVFSWPTVTPSVCITIFLLHPMWFIFRCLGLCVFWLNVLCEVYDSRGEHGHCTPLCSQYCGQVHQGFGWFVSVCGTSGVLPDGDIGAMVSSILCVLLLDPDLSMGLGEVHFEVCPSFLRHSLVFLRKQ